MLRGRLVPHSSGLEISPRFLSFFCRTFYSKSTKQLVYTSSTQSEIRALQSLVVEIIFINELCKELGRPILLFEEDAAVIALSREMTSRAKRCKHYLMAISWIREQVDSGLIIIEKCF